VDRLGCEECAGDDAAAAWEVIRGGRDRMTLIAESHHDVWITRCARCPQQFVVVFTERIDWAGGNDPQDWYAVPIATAEASELARVGAQISNREIERLATNRRYLWRSFPPAGVLATVWCEGALWIGPHD
jgi:hypothetical protein